MKIVVLLLSLGMCLAVEGREFMATEGLDERGELKAGLPEREFEMDVPRAKESDLMSAQANLTLVERNLEEDENLGRELGEMEQRDEGDPEIRGLGVGDVKGYIRQGMYCYPYRYSLPALSNPHITYQECAKECDRNKRCASFEYTDAICSTCSLNYGVCREAYHRSSTTTWYYQRWRVFPKQALCGGVLYGTRLGANICFQECTGKCVAADYNTVTKRCYFHTTSPCGKKLKSRPNVTHFRRLNC